MSVLTQIFTHSHESMSCPSSVAIMKPETRKSVNLRQHKTHTHTPTNSGLVRPVGGAVGRGI